MSKVRKRRLKHYNKISVASDNSEETEWEREQRETEKRIQDLMLEHGISKSEAYKILHKEWNEEWRREREEKERVAKIRADEILKNLTISNVSEIKYQVYVPRRDSFLADKLPTGKLRVHTSITNSGADKPIGAFWTSTLNREDLSSEWLDLCRNEYFWEANHGDDAAIFKVKEDVKLLKLTNIDDYNIIRSAYETSSPIGGESMNIMGMGHSPLTGRKTEYVDAIDWSKLKDYDGVYCTDKDCQYGWDAESIAWFNMDAIELVSVIKINKDCRLEEEGIEGLLGNNNKEIKINKEAAIESSPENFIKELHNSNLSLALIGRDIGWKMKFSDDCAVKFLISPLYHNAVYLSTIEVTPDENCRGKGYGSDVMDMISDLADKHNVIIHLIASPSGEMKMPEEKLRLWYKKFGFEDFDSSQRMIRYPNKNNETKEVNANELKYFHKKATRMNVNILDGTFGDPNKDERRKFIETMMAWIGLKDLNDLSGEERVKFLKAVVPEEKILNQIRENKNKYSKNSELGYLHKKSTTISLDLDDMLLSLDEINNIKYQVFVPYSGEFSEKEMLPIDDIYTSLSYGGADKPIGTFWTSTLKESERSSEWLDLCRNPNFIEAKAGESAAIYEIDMSKNPKILKMDNKNDYNKIRSLYEKVSTSTGHSMFMAGMTWHPPEKAIDWKNLSLITDYDGIYCSNEYCKYGWDAESIAWFKMDSLKLLGDVRIDENCKLDLNELKRTVHYKESRYNQLEFFNKKAKDDDIYTDKDRQDAKEAAIQLALQQGCYALSRDGLLMYAINEFGNKILVTEGTSYHALWHETLKSIESGILNNLTDKKKRSFKLEYFYKKAMIEGVITDVSDEVWKRNIIKKPLYHATYKSKLKSILEKGLLICPPSKAWKECIGELVYLSEDYYIAEGYAEVAMEEMEDDEVDSLGDIVVLEIDSSKLDYNKLIVDPNQLGVSYDEHLTLAYKDNISPELISITNVSDEAWERNFPNQNVEIKFPDIIPPHILEEGDNNPEIANFVYPEDRNKQRVGIYFNNKLVGFMTPREEFTEDKESLGWRVGAIFIKEEFRGKKIAPTAMREFFSNRKAAPVPIGILNKSSQSAFKAAGFKLQSDEEFVDKSDGWRYQWWIKESGNKESKINELEYFYKKAHGASEDLEQSFGGHSRSYYDMPEKEKRKMEETIEKHKGLTFPKDKVLYHGTKKKIKEFKLMPHWLFKDEKVIFGTPEKGMALSFLADWNDDDFDQGTINMGPLYMEELYEGAFEKIYKGKTGHLYHLDGKDFKYYPQLMTKERATKKVPDILKIEVIEDILEALKESGMKMVYYNDKKDSEVNILDEPMPDPQGWPELEELIFIHHSQDLFKELSPTTYEEVARHRNSKEYMKSRKKTEEKYKKILKDKDEEGSYLYASVFGYSQMHTEDKTKDYPGYTYYFKMTEEEIEECIFEVVKGEGEGSKPLKGMAGLKKAIAIWKKEHKKYKPYYDDIVGGDIEPRIEVVIPIDVRPFAYYPQIEDRDNKKEAHITNKVRRRKIKYFYKKATVLLDKESCEKLKKLKLRVANWDIDNKYIKQQMIDISNLLYELISIFLCREGFYPRDLVMLIVEKYGAVLHLFNTDNLTVRREICRVLNFYMNFLKNFIEGKNLRSGLLESEEEIRMMLEKVYNDLNINIRCKRY